MLAADTTVTWSLLGESNPDCLSTGEACFPLPLSRRELAGALGGSRTRNIRPLKPASLPGWSTSTWSRRPVPTRAVRCTKAEPQPCAAASLPLLDLNQDFRSQGPASCQLDEKALRAEGAIRTRMPRGLSSRGLPVAITSACAARESNPDLAD